MNDAEMAAVIRRALALYVRSDGYLRYPPSGRYSGPAVRYPANPAGVRVPKDAAGFLTGEIMGAIARDGPWRQAIGS